MIVASEVLLRELGIKSYTPRHIKIIENFIENGFYNDCSKLLDQLGEWDMIDLLKTQNWYLTYKNQE